MDFKLPEIGEGVQEGELIKWLVKEGDRVEADQALLEVMTDKATVEIPSQVAGIVKSLTAKEGQMIKVGQVLGSIEEGGGASAGAPPKAAAKEAGKEKGFVLYEEVNDLLAEEFPSSREFEELLTDFDTAGVEILDVFRTVSPAPRLKEKGVKRLVGAQRAHRLKLPL